MSRELNSTGVASRLFQLPFGAEVCFVHVIVFIGSRAVDPCLEDSLACRTYYIFSANSQGLDSTDRRRTSPPACGLHRFPLHDRAIPEQSPTRLGDWVVRLSPAEGSNGDPRSLGRRIIRTELTDQLLLIIHKPTVTIVQVAIFTGVF